MSGTHRRSAFDGGTSTETDPSFRRRTARLVNRPFLFLILEARRPLTGGARFALADVNEILFGRGVTRQCTRSRSEAGVQMRVLAQDSYLSQRHARIRNSGTGWTIEDLDSRNGSFVNGQQISRAALNPGDVIALGRVFFAIEYHEVPESWDEDPWSQDLDLEEVDHDQVGLLTLVPDLGLRIHRLRDQARSSGTITVVGETGTGKELLAQAIHRLSRRRGPCLAINCGAVPRDLIQSQLFGHTKGAFTGAPGSIGYVRDADKGTLLLDEVIEGPPETQLALLRVMQERAVTPVGATRAYAVDVRFVAASQHSLAHAVATRGFRPDLQARLESFVFDLPPLRSRREDMGVLVAHNLRAVGVVEKDAPSLSPEAAWRLLAYDWPRNIRELAAAIHRGWVGSREGVIGEADLPEPRAVGVRLRPDLPSQLMALLRTTRGNVSEVARRMGCARQVVHRWLKQFEIDPEKFRC